MTLNIFSGCATPLLGGRRATAAVLPLVIGQQDGRMHSGGRR